MNFWRQTIVTLALVQDAVISKTPQPKQSLQVHFFTFKPEAENVTNSCTLLTRGE